MFNTISKFIVVLGLCGITIIMWSREAEAFSFNEISVEPVDSRYQQVFLGDLFGQKQEEIKMQGSLVEEVIDLKIIDKESFYKYAPEIHKTPFNDPVLSFRINLPDTWEELFSGLQSKMELTTSLMSTLAHYVGPPISELRPFLKVQAMKLEREITADNWLRYFMLIRGYSVLDDEISVLDYNNASAHFIYINEDVTYVGYLRVVIHGNIVSLARIDIPQKFTKTYKVLQQESVDSLRLVFPQTGNIEPRKKQKLGDGALYLSYPSSWERKKQSHNDKGDKVAFELHNVADETTVFGLMKFEVVEITKDISLEIELNRVKMELKNKYGMYMKAVSSTEPSFGPVRFDYIREEKYIVGFEKGIDTQEQELTFLVMADAELYVFVYMVSPLKQNDLFNWSINSRAYSIVRESFE